MARAFLDGFETDYPPAFLARYEALECLGQNESGETLYLRDREIGGYAVAKCCREGDLSAREDEGALLERLDHPALPKFLGRYENEHMRCMVREYVRGIPLSEVPVPLPVGEAVDILLQLCDVLTYLHSRIPPVIHRDVKPQNLILGEGGRVTLIDFGISRSYDETARADTVCFGTREFSPPEQYGFAQTDPRSDVYAAGMLLRWLLTGQTDASSGKLPDRRLERVAAKCTAFAPKGRYQSAEKLKKALLWASARGARLRRSAMAAAALIVACGCGFALGRITAAPTPPPAPSGVITVSAKTPSPSGFTEPLIEQAARLALGVKDDSVLTDEQLKGVRTLYVAATQAFPTERAFCDYIDSVQTMPRGPVKSLDDLRRMPNLERVRVVGEHLTDISPLADCPQIIDLELKHNDISDLTPLEELDKLQNVILRENPITDISPLYGKDTLRCFELFQAPGWDVSQAAELSGTFEEFNVQGAGPFLDGKTIQRRYVDWSDFSDMKALDGVQGLRELRADHTPLSDLRGVEVHAKLEQLYLAHTAVTDLTPLLALPNLTTLVLDELQRPYAAVLAEKPGLSIQYTD